MDRYFKKDIADRIDETVRKVQTWADEGYVIPDITPSSGRGTTRVFSKRNLIEFAMIKILKDIDSLTLDVIKEIMAGIRHGRYLEKINEKIHIAEFEDFYLNDEWGNTKELFFTKSGEYYSGNGKFYVFAIGDIHNFELSKNIRSYLVVKLGKTKKDAIQFLENGSMDGIIVPQ